MMTVNEVSKLTGVSIRTLQYYDTIGLLKPIEYTESGYRLYDDTSLERLQQILLFRELEFPLKEIKKIIDAPNFDRNKALEQQIELLTMKKNHLENVKFSKKRLTKTALADTIAKKIFRRTLPPKEQRTVLMYRQSLSGRIPRSIRNLRWRKA